MEKNEPTQTGHFYFHEIVGEERHRPHSWNAKPFREKEGDEWKCLEVMHTQSDQETLKSQWVFSCVSGERW